MNYIACLVCVSQLVIHINTLTITKLVEYMVHISIVRMDTWDTLVKGLNKSTT